MSEQPNTEPTEAMGHEEALRWLDERAAAAFIMEEIRGAPNGATAVAQAIMAALTMAVVDVERAARLREALVRQATRAQNGRDIDTLSRDDVAEFIADWAKTEDSPEDLAAVAAETKEVTGKAIEHTQRLADLVREAVAKGQAIEHDDHIHTLGAPGGDSGLVN